jgi:hypothetical protein
MVLGDWRLVIGIRGQSAYLGGGSQGFDRRLSASGWRPGSASGCVVHRLGDGERFELRGKDGVIAGVGRE